MNNNNNNNEDPFSNIKWYYDVTYYISTLYYDEHLSNSVKRVKFGKEIQIFNYLKETLIQPL